MSPSARRLGLFVMLLALLTPGPALPLPPPPVVPDALQPWVPWVLHQHRDLLCAQLGDQRTCAWPGHLQVRIDDHGAELQLDLWLDAPGSVGLPGDETAWPVAVTVDGQPALVQAEDERPTVALPPGHHRVTARLQWDQAPELLALPPEVGVVELWRAGQKVDAPRRDEEGRLLLSKEGAGEAKELDTLTAHVARRLVDGVPLKTTTRVTLRVGGRARDVVLGPVLLPGARPVSVSSELPVQVGADGAVRVHARPGQHTVDVEAVLPEPATALQAPVLQGDFWEPQEVWAWVPSEAVRSVELGGLQPIDPERTELPADWRKARTFVAKPGQALTLKETRRGEKEAPPSRLQLVRQLWLDLDGQGLTARDRLTGELHQGWRLDAGSGWQLGRAALAAENLLITKDPKTGTAGVELRKGVLDLEADLRAPDGRGRMRIVGWGADVQSLKAELHLPPGWTLLGAEGVDKMPQTWLDSWTLLDFFLVLMVALGFGKLLGWGWGLVALLALGLCHDQPDAPLGLWLNVLAALALLTVLPRSWFRRVVAGWFALGVVLLISTVIPFAAQQIRHGIYPQIGQAAGGFDSGLGRLDEEAKSAPEAPPPPPEPPPAAAAAPVEAQGNIQAQRNLQAMQAEQDQVKEAEKAQDSFAPSDVGGIGLLRGSGAGGGGVAGKKGWSSYDYRAQKLQQVDPNAVVQTGPGVPKWAWSRWPLGWSGPVRGDHEVQLWLLSPAHNLLLAILRVILVVALTLRLVDWRQLRALVGRLQVHEPARPPEGSVPPPGSLVVLLLAAGLALIPGIARAQVQAGGAFPPQELLEQLRQRLEESQQCDGPCLVVHDLELVARGQQVRLTAQVSSQRAAGWALPGPLDALQLREVLLDGKPTWDLRRTPEGLVAVRVPAGAHTVTATATLPRRSVVDLRFDAQGLPHHLKFRSRDWALDGLDEHGVPEPSLQLTRQARKAGAPVPEDDGLPADASEGAEGAVPVPADATRPNADGTGGLEMSPDLPPWFEVERHLLLGLPWKVHTTVRRGDGSRPQIVKVPLLPGETLLTDGVRVEEAEPGPSGRAGGRRALVSFDRDQTEVTLESELAVVPQLVLQAPPGPGSGGEPWTETWRLDCSPIWRCSWQGLAPVHTRDPSDAALRPVFQPWPGEKVTVEVVRPEGAPGQAVTVDKVDYRVTPGQRLLEAVLTLQVRTSQGGWQKVTLPEGAQVQTVHLRGQARTIRPEGRVLRLPLEPGPQEIVVRWQQPWQRHFHEAVPPVDLGAPDGGARVGAANVTTTLVLGEDRWLLWALGPTWGPAVLFWSHLLLVLAAAALLGRLRGLPLKTWQWLLLGLGLAQVPVPAALVVVGWLILLAWRRGQAERLHKLPPVVFDAMQLGLALLSVIALAVLYGAIHQNLLLDVDMQVRGGGSDEHTLRWYVDRVTGPLPAAAMISAPLWLWRVAMLAWALWLVASLLRWLPWAWRALASGGLWQKLSRPLPKKPIPPPPPPPPPVQTPASGA